VEENDEFDERDELNEPLMTGMASVAVATFSDN
jgi:hypothetical protein